MTIEGLALWNREASDNTGIQEFVLFADDENTFTDATNLGTFDATPPDVAGAGSLHH